jgi:hypothetical protein
MDLDTTLLFNSIFTDAVRGGLQKRLFSKLYRDSVTNRFMMNDWFPYSVVYFCIFVQVACLSYLQGKGLAAQGLIRGYQSVAQKGRDGIVDGLPLWQQLAGKAVKHNKIAARMNIALAIGTGGCGRCGW